MAEGLEARLAACAAAVDAALARALAQAGWPERLAEAMAYALLGGGKRLRPFLVVETARLFGQPSPAAFALGAALECVHAYSLVHDDLPAMDDDDVRRGRPTLHRAYDEATAILVGDALQALAFQLVAEAPGLAPEAVGALVADLARAAGAAGMVGGQMLDLAAEGRYAPDGVPPGLDAAAVCRLQALKTGALFGFAVRAGARLGGASGEETVALDRYAHAFGLAFQIADDLLDATGEAAVVGKTVAKDAARGKATLVGLLGVQGAQARRDAVIAEAEAALAPFGARGAGLVALVHHIGRRTR